VLTASRRDEALTRDCLPSPFFVEAERAASGHANGSLTRVTSLGTPVTAGPSVSEGEAYDRALERSGPATVAAVHPSLARALARQELAHAPRWTPFEGKLGAAARPALVRHRPSAVASLSASKVEMFATCSYRYFLRCVQGLREWEEPDRVAELDPLALGTVFHDAARRIVASAVAWPPSPDEAGTLAGLASEEALAHHESGTGPIVPLLVRDISRRRIEALVRGWLGYETARRDGLRPSAAELVFGKDAPFVVEAGGVPIRFSGSIDRLDVDREGRPARVVDYKVKAAAVFKNVFGEEGRIVGGEAAQLPVYALATGGPVAAEYVFLMAGNAESPRIEPVSFTPEQMQEAIAQLRTFLSGMEAAITSGTFLPRTAARLRKEPCAFCEFTAVCGPGHIDRYAAKENDSSDDARSLRALRELP
jgi:RecB family exonuclease